jgi:hypothetical protein
MLPGTFTANNVNGPGGFASQTPAITAETSGDGSVDETSIVGQVFVDALSGSTHFNSGLVGYATCGTSSGAINRCIGVLGVPVASSNGTGSAGALIGFDSYGATINSGATVGAAIGYDAEPNFGVYTGNLQSLVDFEANSPGAGYTTGPYYAFYAGGGGTLGTVNYGLYIDNTSFNGANDYGIYVQAAKSYFGGGTQVVKSLFSALPTCTSSIEGTTRAVTDSSTATWGATITGLGSNHVKAYCDGTNWTVEAK